VDLVTLRQPPPAGPPRPGTIQGFGGPLPLEARGPSPAPSDRRARPPVMINHPHPEGIGQALNRKLLSIIEHNCLGSWDLFLSLFESFREATIYS